MIYSIGEASLRGISWNANITEKTLTIRDTGNNVVYTGTLSGNHNVWKVRENGDGTVTLLSAVDSGFALDVSGGNAQNGRNVQIYQSNGTKAQKWKLKKISS